MKRLNGSKNTSSKIDELLERDVREFLKKEVDV